MLPDIIKTEYEVEILSDNSNVYAPGDFYPSSDFIVYFLAQYHLIHDLSCLVEGIDYSNIINQLDEIIKTQ